MSEQVPTKDQLQPCPFCGVQAKVRQASNAPVWIVGCTSVRCDFRPEFQHIDKQYAIKKWNQRA